MKLGGIPSRRRLTSVRTLAALGVLVGAAIGVVALSRTVAAGGSGGHEDPQSITLPVYRPSGRVRVPRVVGMTEARAVKALGAAGLVANVRFAKEAPRTGKVLRSDPEAGRDVRARSVVILAVALGPPLPVPAVQDERNLHALGRLVEDNPGAFVGLYLDAEGVPHAVFGRGVEPAEWTGRLDAAAAGTRYWTETCAHDPATLRAVKDRIATKDWTADQSVPFSVDVHPATCTVRVESDLLAPSDVDALAERFGPLVSLDTTEGSHPVLLPAG